MTSSPSTWPIWWLSNRPAKVLSCVPYTGRYKDSYSHILRLEAPRTVRGWLEVSVKL